MIKLNLLINNTNNNQSTINNVTDRNRKLKNIETLMYNKD
ncbi:hypothetical protein SAMN05192588_2503 [Nonlabens sp. Hel1_33_55]|nr:hypothetical protein SAMN05192588_2503 [Nonlabens sp. Hel1_33_55]